jgi:hypothetical protein
VQGSDARDALLGRIFGYSAFAQAGRASDNTVADRLVVSLIAVMGRKSFLREAAANALVTCLEALPTATLKHVLSSSEPLQSVLTRKPEEATPEVTFQILSSLLSRSRKHLEAEHGSLTVLRKALYSLPCGTNAHAALWCAAAPML